MEPKDFIVVEIEGEYAYLREVGAEAGNERFIALALLPEGWTLAPSCITRC